jgi:F-type H+-transporting ATPase subunit delta
MITESPVSRVYAQALVELGDRHESLERLHDEFDAFHGIWKESRPLREAVISPAVGRDDKVRLIRRLCEDRFSDLFRRFLSILARKARLALLDQIHASFTRIVEDRGGIVRVRATFAICMEERLVSELEQALGEKLGKRIKLWVKTDPTILGGVVLRIGDRLVDMSLRRRLEQFREAAVAAR